MQSNTEIEEGIIPNNLIIATTPTSNNMRRRRFNNITATSIDNDEYNDEPVYSTTSRQLDLSDGYNNINDEIAMREGKKRGYTQHKKKKERSLISILTFLMALLYTLGGHTTIIKQLQSTTVSIIPTSISRMLSLSSNMQQDTINNGGDINNNDELQERPSFVYEHPYVSSSYYTSTNSIETLMVTQDNQVIRNLRREAEQAAYGYDSTTNGEEGEHEKKRETRLAIVRPFCEFDAEALPTTFTCWNALPPCKAATDDIGDDEVEEERYEVDNYGELVSYNSNSTSGRSLYDQATTSGEDRHTFDLVGSDAMKNEKADVFLFYSQTFSENDVAIKAVDTIIDQFFEPGGWSQCFDNIYAIEANIPQELDLYIPSAQEELYNWVNGPNRQFEAAFRIIQSGEWGEYDGFYLMEGDSVPIKAYWLDVVLSEIEVNRPFAILGA